MDNRGRFWQFVGILPCLRQRGSLDSGVIRAETLFGPQGAVAAQQFTSEPRIAVTPAARFDPVSQNAVAPIVTLGIEQALGSYFFGCRICRLREGGG